MNLSRSTLPTRRLIVIVLALCACLAPGATQAQSSLPCEALMGDQRVAAAVESRLKASSRIQADDIVVAVASGVAQLRGLARSEAQKRIAGQVASDTRGVDRLDNQLDVVDWTPVTDAARADASLRDGTHQSRQVRTDAWITTAVENTLALSHSTDNCRIVVRTRDGIVALQGVMTSPEARRAAVELAAGTYGVRSVQAEALLLPASASAH
jgi:hyperosmotically inducible periplasmic protein